MKSSQSFLLVILILLPFIALSENGKDELRNSLVSIDSALRAAETIDQKRAEELGRSFFELSTGLQVAETNVAKETGILKEIQKLLEPLVAEVRRITDRPRKLSDLRTREEELERKVLDLEHAESKVTALINSESIEPLKKRLLTVQRDVQAKLGDIGAELAVTRQRVATLERSSEGLAKNIATGLKNFFGSRGLNLAIALLVTLVVSASFRFGRIVIMKMSLPTKGERNTSPSYRVFSVLYLFGTFLGGICAFLATLFLLGDWLLLSIAALVLLGVAWASKEALPRFWNQVVLLLNMGAAREGERVLYQGLPFQIRALGLFTTLINPALVGVIRIPIADMVGMRSRPVADEVWFPTNVGDYILDEDGVSQVIKQGVEFVTLRYLGGALRTFASSEFIKEGKTNLSSGFRVSVPIHIGHEHLKEATSTVPELLKSAIERELSQRGATNSVEQIRVEFSETTFSALEILANVDFRGDLAAQYHILNRFIKRVLTETCVQNQLTLPFEQVRLHFNKPLQHDAPNESSSAEK